METEWVATADVRVGDRLACLLSDASAYPAVTGWADRDLDLGDLGIVTHRTFTVSGDCPWWVAGDDMRTGSLGDGELHKTLIVRRCNCGHPPAARYGFTPGYAEDTDGYRMCYACLDVAEATRFATAHVFSGYVNEQDKTFTTWTGGKLATITSLYYGETRYTPTGGSYSMRYIRATAPDGVVWAGHGSSAHDLVTLRRATPMTWQLRGVTVIQLDRLPSSRLGNPRWRVHLDNGDTLITRSDASDSYGIGNRELRGRVDITLTPAGRLSRIRPAVPATEDTP